MRFHRESGDESYDAVVIGAGLGGLSAGALLARHGRKVLVVERHDRPGGYAHAFKRRRYHFDSAIHLIGGCGSDANGEPALVERVLRTLGVRDRLDLVRVDPFYSAVFPDFRLDAPLGIEAFVETHVRAFPAEGKGFRRVLDTCSAIRAETQRVPDLDSVAAFVKHAKQLPTLIRYHRATLADVLDDHLDDERAKAAFGAPWPYLGLPPSRVSFLYYAMMLLSYLEDGAWYSRGSFQRLAEALVHGLERDGGELLLKSTVRRIDVEHGRAQGVVLENGQRIAAPVVVSAADALQTYDELIGGRSLPRRFLQGLSELVPSLSAFVVYGATTLDLRAAGAQHEMFLYRTWDHDEDYANALRGRISRIGFTVPTLADDSLAPRGEHLFTITVLLPYDVVGSWREEKERYMQLLLREADEHFPGLIDGLRFAEAGTPRTMERYTRNTAGAMYGWEMSPGQTGPLRLEPQTPIGGLYLAGHWTQPGGGVYGVIASGASCAQRVLGFESERRLWIDQQVDRDAMR